MSAAVALHWVGVKPLMFLRGSIVEGDDSETRHTQQLTESIEPRRGNESLWGDDALVSCTSQLDLTLRASSP